MPADRDDGFGRFVEGVFVGWGVSRDEFCEKAETDPSMVSKEFSGSREIPKKKLVLYVAAARDIYWERRLEQRRVEEQAR